MLHVRRTLAALYKSHTTVCVLYVANLMALFSNLTPRDAG
jgi:hypothetical protein